MDRASPPLEPLERSTSWTWALCGVLFAATFINYANRVVLTQNAAQVQKAFDASREDYGRINGRFGLGFAFGAIVFGSLADVIPVRWLYPGVVLIWSAFGALSGRARDLDELIWCQTLLGFFEAGHWPCALRTTQRVFTPDRRTVGNSLLQSGAAVATVVVPLGILALYRYNPLEWKWAFFAAAGLGVPWAMLWLTLVRDEDLSRPVIQTDDSGAGTTEAPTDQPFLSVFLMRRWWVLLAIVSLINVTWHFIRVWMPLLFEEGRGYSHEFVQEFTSAYYAATFFGSLASGALTAWLARTGWGVHRSRLIAFLFFSLLTALAAPAAFLPNGNPMLATMLLVGFGSLGLFPVYYSLNQEISAKHQGKVGGVLGFIAWAEIYFVQPAVGRAIDQDPSIQPWLFAGVGLLPLIGWVVLAIGWGNRTARVTSDE